jgi:hypothetical protein
MRRGVFSPAVKLAFFTACIVTIHHVRSGGAVIICRHLSSHFERSGLASAEIGAIEQINSARMVTVMLLTMRLLMFQRMLKRIGTPSLKPDDAMSAIGPKRTRCASGRQVQMPVSAKGWAQMYLKENPWTYSRRKTRQEWDQAALKQVHVAVNSILRDCGQSAQHTAHNQSRWPRLGR